MNVLVFVILFFFVIISLTNTITISVFATPNSPTNPSKCLIPDERLKANAGLDQTLKSGDRVTLNGSRSTGPIFSYQWIPPFNLPQGTDFPLSSNVKVVTFTTPPVLSTTIYTFQLFVRDNEINCSSDYIDIAVEPTKPVARFEWSMQDRFGLDKNNDDIIDYDYSQQYINPSSGYSVNFDGCSSFSGSSQINSYVWKIEGKGISNTISSGNSCKIPNPISLQQGLYDVTLTVTTQNGQSDYVTKTVVVNDLLIVSIGDSYASGEGNPDKRLIEVSNIQRPVWEDKRCHRSAEAGPAQAALKIERSDPHSSVTFLSYACSGAELPKELWVGIME